MSRSKQALIAGTGYAVICVVINHFSNTAAAFSMFDTVSLYAIYLLAAALITAGILEFVREDF